MRHQTVITLGHAENEKDAAIVVPKAEVVAAEQLLSETFHIVGVGIIREVLDCDDVHAAVVLFRNRGGALLKRGNVGIVQNTCFVGDMIEMCVRKRGD